MVGKKDVLNTFYMFIFAAVGDHVFWLFLFWWTSLFSTLECQINFRLQQNVFEAVRHANIHG